MEKLDAVIKHLKQIGPSFWGTVKITIKQGRAVLITEERTIKLDCDESNFSEKGNKTQIS